MKRNYTLLFVLVLGLLTIGANNTFSHKGIMTVEAKLIEKPFINKIGKEGSFKDLYLVVKQHTYFIKWSASKVTKAEMMRFLNRKVKVKIEIRNGLWDTDDPNIQSRVGDYVVILKLFDSKSE